MPASRKTLLAMSPTARPTPCGAGFRNTSTEPLLPDTLNGSVWARPQPHSQEPQPRLISIMLSFALSIARRIDGPTSRPRARPRPAKPSLFPTMHVITKFTRRPESVMRCTMFTSRTSSSVWGRRMSTISGSRIGRPVRIASPSVVSSPARTSRPSFVFGAHSLRFLSGLAARASRLRPRPPRRCGIRGPPVLSSPRRTGSGSIPRCGRPGSALSRARPPGCVARIRRNRGGLGGPSHPQVEDGLGHAFGGRALPGKIAGQVGGRQIARARGPPALLQLEGLRGRDDPISRGVRNDELHDRLVESLPDDDAGLPAPKQLRPARRARRACGARREGRGVGGSLLLFGPSLIAPPARICGSRGDFVLNIPPWAGG